MWLRRTRRAEKALIDAYAEAQYQGQSAAQSQHLLLALVQDPDNFSARILKRLGLSLPEIQFEIGCSQIRESERELEITQWRRRTDALSRSEIVQGVMPRLAEYHSDPVLAFAADEAKRLNNTYIGTEHLLLGLIGESGGMASHVLANLGVDLDRARREVVALQAGPLP